MGKKHWLVTLAALVAGPGLARAAGHGPEPAVLYLNFSDGTENVVKAADDDAAANQSVMGAASPYPAFAWPGMADETARRELMRDLTERIHEVFLPYNIVVTTTRPAAGPYTMVMIGGSPALFNLEPRVAGVAYMDCDNRQASNVVFAFPVPLGGSVHGLFSTIAQEAAHALGLQHSSDPNDIMYPRVDLAQRNFQDRESLVASPKYCGPSTQNSHRRLLELVGTWVGSDKPMEAPLSVSATDRLETLGGCSVGPAGARRGKGGRDGAPAAGWVAILVVFAVGACGRRRGRL